MLDQPQIHKLTSLGTKTFQTGVCRHIKRIPDLAGGGNSDDIIDEHTAESQAKVNLFLLAYSTHRFFIAPFLRKDILDHPAHGSIAGIWDSMALWGVHNGGGGPPSLTRFPPSLHRFS